MKKWIAGICAAAMLFSGIPASAAGTLEEPEVREVKEVIQLDSEQIGQTSQYDHIIFSEEKNGIYFMKTVGTVYSNSQSYEIVFYDIENDTYTTVYEISNTDTSYAGTGGVYFADCNMKREAAGENEDGSTAYVYKAEVTISGFDLNTQEASVVTLDDITATANWAGYISAFGVDGMGRIYVSTYDDELLVFDSEGSFIRKTAYTGQINEFYGFDSTNGNFYYEGNYNWVYWGYNHYMSSLMAGNLGMDGTITLPEANLMILYQTGFYTHYSPVQMLNDQYLGALTTFSGDVLMVLDSNAYDVSDHTEQSTSIDLTTSGVSVSILNIENKETVLMGANTAASEYENYEDTTSVGARCAVSPDNSSIYIKTDANCLTEYGMDKEKKIDLQTTYPAYTFAVTEDSCQVIEKDGDNWYLEILGRAYPTDFAVSAPNSLKVGESSRIQCSTDGAALLDYTFASSASEILSVDEKGMISAWKAGQAEVTVTAMPGNMVKTFTISVTDSAVSQASIYSVEKLAGAASNTMHKPKNYGRYGNTIDAYLTPLATGGYERVEYTNSKVLVEIYDASLNLVTQKYLDCELPLWGAFYSGNEYNFLVFGQKNPEESDECEVFRIVKYDKNWNRLSACSIKGANTYIPFDAGGCSMAELNGMLYVHTCHEMYMSSDGYHHQANCTFKIQESDMSVQDSFTSVMNLSTGYVSHSFMQIVRADGTDIYRADLGDAYPRGIALTRTSADAELGDPKMYGSVVSIPGSTGANYTGYALSGLELSETNYILAGSGINNTTERVSNILVSAGAKDEWNTDVKWITNYDSNSKVTVQPPKLVKLNSSQFLLMWEEFDKSEGNYSATKLVLLNQDGTTASKIYSTGIALSACSPVVNANGTVSWFVTAGSAPKLVTINPYHLAEFQEQTESFVIFQEVETEEDNNQNGNDQNNNQNGSDQNKNDTQDGLRVLIGKRTYQVTGASTVTWLGTINNNAAVLKIPAAVKINGKKYKVTAVAANACKNNRKLKKVVIGKNVQTIGKKAFFGCSSLKTVRIKSQVLTKVGKKAFYKTYTSIKFTVPKKKVKLCQVMLKKSKLPKKAKIKG